jgi:hypothetical protein
VNRHQPLIAVVAWRSSIVPRPLAISRAAAGGRLPPRAGDSRNFWIRARKRREWEYSRR